MTAAETRNLLQYLQRTAMALERIEKLLEDKQPTAPKPSNGQ